MKRLYRATTTTQRNTVTTFELEDGRISCFAAEHRDFLADWLKDLFDLEPEQKEEFKDLLRNYGYESKIAFGLQLLGYKAHPIDDATAERDGALIILTGKKQKPEYMQEYHQLVGILYQQLGFIEDPGEREVIAICGAYVFFEPEKRQEIADYQYNRGLEDIKVKTMPSTIQRDQTMEGRIRRIWNETDADLIHVGGLFHIYGPYQNLYDRLQDLNPIRRKLNEF